MRVLVVEDNLDALECLRAYCTERGDEVMTALTAEEALQRLGATVPDLALVDLLLPRGHGREVIREIIRRRLPTRIVVITACDDLELRKELLSLGVSEYLFKPVTIRDLDALFAASAKSAEPAPLPPDGQPEP